MATDIGNLPNILNPVAVKKLVQEWIMEDQPAFDIQSLVCQDKSIETIVWCKSSGSPVLAGVPFVNALASELGVAVTWFVQEGQVMSKGKTCMVRGVSHQVLRMERVALNLLARSCGIATLTRRICDKLRSLPWKGHLAGTRKTTPGFRLVEKYSMIVGGASPHRYDLSHMVMLKDNHLDIKEGDITSAIKLVKSMGDFASKVEVECASLKQAQMAIEAGADIVMLDNLDAKTLVETAKLLKGTSKHILIEASGGITESTIDSYASPFVDIISMSQLTQAYVPIDFSMKVSSIITKE